MATIYVHGSAALGSDAATRLPHLTEAGHDVVLVAADDHPASGQTVWSGQVPTMPSDPPRGTWLLTADPATCTDRRPELRTLLIGPRPADRRPTRCDASVRDLREAVLEILAADAML